MTTYFKKWHLTKLCSDFDAVILYPSEMSGLYTVKGVPQVIEEDQLNLEFLSKYYPFPLILQKVNGLNLNDDNITSPIKMIFDDITIEDLIEFQKIDFEIIRGYYWNGEKDYTVQKVIRNIFEKRKEYKKQKNPLENLFKFIMNSCYGKTILKLIEKDCKFINEGEDLNKFWVKNYNKIIEDISLRNSNICAVKCLKPINKHFN